MSLSLYSVISYFDFSTTASCGGSPIVVTSVGTGCNSAVADNTNGRTCAPYQGSISYEYTMYTTQCSNVPIDFSGYKRNYVVKSSYSQSGSCEGSPLQVYAVAGDSICHLNPTGSNGTLYVKANCNGGQPIWQECSDSACSKCSTINYTNTPCQLAGAGASSKVECQVAPVGGGTDNGMKSNGTSGGGVSSTLPEVNSDLRRSVTSSNLLFGVLSSALSFCM